MLYFAYGSNLNHAQMKETRCMESQYLNATFLENYKLSFCHPNKANKYGYANVKDVLLGKTNTLTKADNYDSFELNNIIKWWKKKAIKRYNNIIKDGRIRKELEVWNKDTMNRIDIIR